MVDLIPNGRNIAVTDANKIDYIRLISHHRLTSAIRAQIDNFLEVETREWTGFCLYYRLINYFSNAESEFDAN